MKEMKNDGYTLSTVVTATKLIELIGYTGSATPSQIAKKLQLTRSNVHRLLATLQELGYVAEGLYNTYSLTFKLFELGNTIPHRRLLIDVSRPSMLRLAQLTGYTVNNAVLYENEVLYIDKVEANAFLKLDRSIGNSDPVHSTSLGKALLAFQKPEERQRILSEIELFQSTPHTITEKEKFMAELEQIHSAGFAMDRRELSMDLVCVAVPVFDCRGEVCSAVSVSGPSDRFTPDEAEKIVPDLKATSGEITRKLCNKL